MDKDLKSKIRDAAETLNFIFEDTKIDNVKVRGDRVIFYEGDKEAFNYSKEEIRNKNF